MPKKASASNSVVSSVEEAAALFGVPSYRMNSRTFMVPGLNGRMRPMFMGQWTDDDGTAYRKGMADLLLSPKVPIGEQLVAVPLWVECKSGSGRLSPEQKAFRDHVTRNGAFFIEARDCATAVIEWFRARGVSRN